MLEILKLTEYLVNHSLEFYQEYLTTGISRKFLKKYNKITIQSSFMAFHFCYKYNPEKVHFHIFYYRICLNFFQKICERKYYTSD